MTKSSQVSFIMSFIIILVVCSCGISIAYFMKSTPTAIATNEITNNKDYKITKSENANYITYNVEDYERDLTYSWDFIKDKSKSVKENIAMDVNLRLDIDDINTEDTKAIANRVEQNKLIVSFDHHGTLPLNAKVKINVADKFEDHENLYLYYYNPETKNIEFIDKDLLVKEGYVTFTIDHCSDYFLTAAVVNDAINNPKSLNYIIIGLGVVVVILIAVTLIQSKK